MWFVVEEFVYTWFNEFQFFLTMSITWIYLLWRFEFLVQLIYKIFEKLCPMDSILWCHSMSTLGFHFCLHTWPLEMFWRNWISQDVMKYLHQNTMRTSFHTAVSSVGFNWSQSIIFFRQSEKISFQTVL